MREEQGEEVEEVLRAFEGITEGPRPALMLQIRDMQPKFPQYPPVPVARQLPSMSKNAPVVVPNKLPGFASIKRQVQPLCPARA